MLPTEEWLARYRIEAPLGGAHYAVYRALDKETQARVALKILRPECLGSDASFRAFWSDTRIRAELHCPALPRVLAHGQAPLPWSASEWIEGFPLHVLFGAGDAALRAGMTAVLQAAETLAAAGVLPSDCHPSNWLLAKNRAVYVDCGDVTLSNDAGALRKELGNLFYCMAVGRDAVGHWSEALRALGAPVPAAPDVTSLRPELKTSSTLISKLRNGEAITSPAVADWRACTPATLAPFGRALSVDDVTPWLLAAKAEGIGHIRLSPVARVDSEGFVHVKRMTLGAPPDRLQSWLEAHALAAEPLLVTCENLAEADADTRIACEVVRARLQRQPLLFVST